MFVARLRIGAIAAAVAAVGVGISSEAAAAKGPTIRFSAPPSGLVAENGSIWVSVAANGALLRLDAQTGRIRMRIDVHRADRRALGGGPLAARDGRVWVAAPVHVDDDPIVGNASGWIGRVDVRHGKLRITQVHGDPPSHVAVGPSGVWVTGGRTVRAVDPKSGNVVRTLRLPAFLGAVAVGTNAVWVIEPNAGQLVEIDPITGHVRGTVTVGRSTWGSSLVVAYDSVWAVTDAGVVRVDQRSRRITTTLHLAGARALSFDGKRIWVTARDGLYSISAGNARKERALESGEGDLVAAARGAVWITAGVSNSLHRVQP
jgi:streptogramin lyase